MAEERAFSGHPVRWYTSTDGSGAGRDRKHESHAAPFLRDSGRTRQGEATAFYGGTQRGTYRGKYPFKRGEYWQRGYWSRRPHFSFGFLNFRPYFRDAPSPGRRTRMEKHGTNGNGIKRRAKEGGDQLLTPQLGTCHPRRRGQTTSQLVCTLGIFHIYHDLFTHTPR